MTQYTSTATTTGTIWEFDPSHSLAEFSVRHMMFTTVKGAFTDVVGTISEDEQNPLRSAVEVTIGVDSINTRSEQRDTHLRSAEFFDVQQFPTMTFRSTRIEQVDDETFNLVGYLTIRGITREVVFKTTINGRGVNPWGQEVAGATAEGSINREDFGLIWNAALETGGVLVGDTVKILIEVQAVKQA